VWGNSHPEVTNWRAIESLVISYPFDQRNLPVLRSLPADYGDSGDSSPRKTAVSAMKNLVDRGRRYQG
jgi:hypothetical protein